LDFAGTTLSLSKGRRAARAMHGPSIEIVPSHRQLGRVADPRLAVLDRDELGEDAHGDLLGRDGADVESDRRMDLLEQVRVRAVARELVVDARHLRPAADESEVAKI